MMIDVTIDPITEEWITIVTEPAIDEMDRLQIRDPVSIVGILGTNQIWVGKPRIIDVRNNANAENEHYLSLLPSDHDVFLVQISCSFRASPKCKFIRATMHFKLESIGNNHLSDPLFIDIHPLEVVMPVTYKRIFSINPQIEFSLEKVAQVNASAFNVENSREYLIYQPQITAFGKGTNEVGWDFSRTSGRDLRGIIDLFALVQKPKGVSHQLRMSLSNCLVQSQIGPIALSSLLVEGEKGTILELVYPF